MNDMPVQTSVHLHAAFQIHLASDFQQSDVGLLQSLLDGGNGVGFILDGDHSQANAVMGDALVDLQFVGERTLQCQMQVPLFLFNAHNGCGLLHYS